MRSSRGSEGTGDDRPSLSGLLRSGAVVIVIALVVTAGVAVTTVVVNAQTAEELVSRVGPLRTSNALLLRTMVDGETGLRGYQVTSDEDVLAPYRDAEAALPDLIDEMRSLAGDNNAWGSLVKQQADLATKWFEEYAPPVIRVVASRGSVSGDRRGTSIAVGRAILDEIRALNAQLDRDLLDTRHRGADQVSRLQIGAVALIAGILTATLILLAVRARRIGRLVTAPLEQLQRAISGLDEGAAVTPAGNEIRGTVEVEQVARALDDLATRNAALLAADRDRLQQERLVRDIARRVRQSLGTTDVLDQAVREIGPATGADHALILAIDEDHRLGEVRVEWCTDDHHPVGAGRRLPDDPDRDAAFASILQERRAVVVDDIASSEVLRPATADLLRSLGAASMLVAPVLAGDVPLGAIVLLRGVPARAWSPSAESVTHALADDLATALSHARLYERQQEMVGQLQELDRAKTDFVSSVSHELRTPLTSIRGYIEMIRDGDAGEVSSDQDRMLGVVERNTDRLLALIEDLLTLSRIESGAFRVVLGPVDLDDLVSGVTAAMTPQAAAQDVELTVSMADDLPTVMGDSQQLERLLLNLLSNAVKFTPDGGRVEVAISADEDTVEIRVSDEGIGIPVAEQDRLFSRFFRSSKAQERAIQGTGLGLVIVKGIVEHHHGEIDVESEPGRGTTFRVRLPTAPRTTGAT